jgi:hypothetical protein
MSVVDGHQVECREVQFPIGTGCNLRLCSRHQASWRFASMLVHLPFPPASLQRPINPVPHPGLTETPGQDIVGPVLEYNSIINPLQQRRLKRLQDPSINMVREDSRWVSSITNASFSSVAIFTIVKNSCIHLDTRTLGRLDGSMSSIDAIRL